MVGQGICLLSLIFLSNGKTVEMANQWTKMNPIYVKPVDCFLKGISWDALPDELLLGILAYLPLIDLLKVSQICKRWQCLA